MPIDDDDDKQTEATARGKARRKARADNIRAVYRQRVRAAKLERDGYLWLDKQGIPTDNVAWNPRTGRFVFGWRRPLDEPTRDALRQKLIGFPCPFYIDTDV